MPLGRLADRRDPRALRAGLQLAQAAVAAAYLNRTGYALLVVGNAATYLASAALLLRLPAFPPVAPARGTMSRPALRDLRFLVVSGASAALALHQTVLALVVPLWIVSFTRAPRPLVSAVLVANTVLTVLLVVRLGSGVRRAAEGARGLRRAGAALGVAALLWAGAAGGAAGRRRRPAAGRRAGAHGR